MKTLPWLTLALVLAAPLYADRPAEPPARRAANLVRQLGDDSFEVRERAGKDLLRLGVAARRALQEGARDADPEVRRRCKELLPAVLEADHKARLDAFLADKDGRQEHHLPGWERYRQVAGQDAAARAFFATLLRHDMNFLADVEKDPARAGERCSEQCHELFGRMVYGGMPGVRTPLDLADVAEVLLVAGDPRVTVPPQSRPWVSTFFYQEPVLSALRGGEQTPFRKLVVAWMERQTDDEDAAQQMFLVMTQTLNLKEALDLGLRVLRDRPVKSRGLAGALVTVGKLGGPAHRTALEPFLNDATIVGNFAVGKERGTTQVRDVALAMLVHVTGQDPKGYGFAFSHRYAYLKFHPSFLGFAGDSERDRALARWRDWFARTKK
jgi:hypothetical protein